MPQILVCPNPKCHKPVQVPDGSGGKQLKCPTCDVMFIVPAGRSGGRPPEELGIHARLRRPPGGNSAAADLNSDDEAE